MGMVLGWEMVLTHYCQVRWYDVIANHLVVRVSFYTWWHTRACGAGCSASHSILPHPLSDHCQKAPDFNYFQGFLLPGNMGLRTSNKIILTPRWCSYNLNSYKLQIAYSINTNSLSSTCHNSSFWLIHAVLTPWIYIYSKHLIRCTPYVKSCLLHIFHQTVISRLNGKKLYLFHNKYQSQIYR